MFYCVCHDFNNSIKLICKLSETLSLETVTRSRYHIPIKVKKRKGTVAALSFIAVNQHPMKLLSEVSRHPAVKSTLFPDTPLAGARRFIPWCQHDPNPR